MLLLLGQLKKYFPEKTMPLQLLFQYVDRQNLERLQQLAEDITAHGVIRNNEFSKAEVIKTGEHHSDALGIVSTAISKLHRDASPYESTNPDYDEQFADTHPSMFFVTVDDGGNYVPPARESSPSNPESTEKSPRKDSTIYEITGYFMSEYIKAMAEKLPIYQEDNAMDTIADGSSKLIAKMLKGLNATLSQGITLDTFSRHAKTSARSYNSKKK